MSARATRLALPVSLAVIAAVGAVASPAATRARYAGAIPLKQTDKMSAKGVVHVKLICHLTPCTGSLVLRAQALSAGGQSVKIGSAAFSLTAGKITPIAVSLTSQGVSRVKMQRSLSVHAAATTNIGTSTGTARRAITLTS